MQLRRGLNKISPRFQSNLGEVTMEARQGLVQRRGDLETRSGIMESNPSMFAGILASFCSMRTAKSKGFCLGERMAAWQRTVKKVVEHPATRHFVILSGFRTACCGAHKHKLAPPGFVVRHWAPRRTSLFGQPGRSFAARTRCSALELRQEARWGRHKPCTVAAQSLP
jgi:hypothetical protein